uniref:Uncharacterized protein n=1 Tax=Anopheles dirus TaxID=7168 RepID=A0A182NXD9_9DIPT
AVPLGVFRISSSSSLRVGKSITKAARLGPGGPWKSEIHRPGRQIVCCDYETKGWSRVKRTPTPAGSEWKEINSSSVASSARGRS